MNKENWLTPQEAAEYLGVSLSLIYRYSHLKQIPSYRLGKYLRFRKAELDAWMASKAQHGDVATDVLR